MSQDKKDIFTQKSNPSTMAGTGIGIQSLENRKTCIQESWKAFKLDFQIYIKAMDMEEISEERKVATLLHFIGSEGRSVFTSLGLDMDNIRLRDLIKYFDDHYNKKNNVTMERHKFFTYVQGEQSIEQFITSLKNLSFSCEFDKLREGLIKSVFICNLNSRHKDIKEKLLSSGNISLNETLEIALVMEASKLNVESLDCEKSSDRLLSEVNVVNRQKYRKQFDVSNYKYKRPSRDRDTSSRNTHAGSPGARKKIIWK